MQPIKITNPSPNDLMLATDFTHRSAVNLYGMINDMFSGDFTANGISVHWDHRPNGDTCVAVKYHHSSYAWMPSMSA